MGVGMAVQCIVGYGYGCDYGFGGLKSLIALVLALRAHARTRCGASGLRGHGVFGGPSSAWSKSGETPLQKPTTNS